MKLKCNGCEAHKNFVGEVCPVCLYEELTDLKRRLREAILHIKANQLENEGIWDKQVGMLRAVEIIIEHVPELEE